MNFLDRRKLYVWLDDNVFIGIRLLPDDHVQAVMLGMSAKMIYARTRSEMLILMVIDISARL